MWRQFVLLVTGGLLQQALCPGADHPAPAAQIVMLQGDHRSEGTTRPPAAWNKNSPFAPLAGNSDKAEQPTRAPDVGREPVVAPEGGPSRQAPPVRSHSVFNSAKPGFPQFPPRGATRALPKPSLFDEIIRISSDRLPANPGHKDAANPVVIAPVSRHVVPAAAAILRQTAGQAPVGSPVSTGEEGAPDDARRAEADPEIAPVATAPVGPAVHRLSQTLRLKLDSVQAGCVGAGILLCLSFQVAIIVVLLKQRSLQPMQSAPLLPVFERSMPLRDRSTAIADLAADSSLWDGAGSSIGRKWQQEEDNLRKQEATIVEEIISRNVILARELAQS